MFDFAVKELEVMFIVTAVFLILPWIAMILRLYVRLVMIKSFGWDDAFILAAMVTFTVNASITLKIGLRPKTLTFDQLNELSLECLVSAGFYLVTTVLLKISLGIFFLCFLQAKWQRRMISICTVAYTIVGIGFLVLLNVQCGDPRHMFSSQLSKHCGPWRILRPLNYTYAVINTVTDLLFALIPIFTIRSMKMRRRAKISASCLCTLGAISSIVSMVRMKYIEGLNVNKHLFPSPAIGTTSSIELGLGMASASAATLRPLFKSMMERVNTFRRTYGTGHDVSSMEASAQRTSGNNEKKNDATSASYGVGKDVMQTYVEVEREDDGKLAVREG